MSHCYSTGLNEVSSLLSSLTRRLRLQALAFALLFAVLLGWPVEAGAIATAAYHGTIGALGSGFVTPMSVAVDASGDVFVADSGAGHVGVYEIVAVNGQVSSSSVVTELGSGFAQPSGVAVDSSGNVFVADQGNGGIGQGVFELKRSSGHYPSAGTGTQLGSGFSMPFGVAVDASGNVYVADQGSAMVSELTPSGGQYPTVGTGTQLAPGTAFNQPTGVTVDASGNVFVADDNVFEIAPGANTATKLATSTNFMGAIGVAVGAGGNIYVSIYGNSSLDEIVASNGLVSAGSSVVLVGNGFVETVGIATDAGGNLFIADYGAPAVKEYSLGITNLGSVNVSSSSATVLVPFTFTVGGTITWNVLTQGAANKDFVEVAGSTTCLTSHTYSTGNTCSVAVKFSPLHPGQRMGSVQLVTGGKAIATALLKGSGSGPQIFFPSNNTLNTIIGGFSEPMAVAVDGSGDVFVADYDSTHVGVWEIVAAGGQVSSSSVVQPVGSGIHNPYDVAVDGSGNVFVADSSFGTVWEIVAVNGQVSSSSTVQQVGGSFASPFGVAVDGSGDVFVAAANDHKVWEIVAVNGQVSSSSWVKQVGGTFTTPTRVAVDGSGNVFVADQSTSKVYEIEAVNGQVSSTSTVQQVGSSFNGVYGMVVDASGDVFVSELGAGTVSEIVAVNGQVSSASTVRSVGSGGSGTSGLAMDGSGNLFLGSQSLTSVYGLALGSVPSYAFAGTTTVNTTDATPFTATIANNGNSTLTFPGLTSSLNPTVSRNFAWDSTSSCNQASSGGASQTLLPGTWCNIVIDFAPVDVSSSISGGGVTLTDDTLNTTTPTYATQLIALSGASSLGTPTVTAQAASSVFGVTPTTLTAQIAYTESVAPTGVVTIQVDSGAALTAACTGSSSPLSCTVSYATGGLSVGGHNINASIASDSNYNAASTSSPGTLTVSPANTTVQVNTPSPASPVVDQAITLSATLIPASGGSLATPTSTMTFFLGGNPISGCTARPMVVWVATCAMPTMLLKGAYNITAAYNAGDMNFNASPVSSISVLSIGTDTTTTAINSSPNPSTLGQSVTLTAKVTPGGTINPVNYVVPSGQVNFSADSTLIPACSGANAVTVTDNHDGTVSAACTISTLLAGSHSVSASYVSGESNFSSSTGSDPSPNVNKASSTIVITTAAPAAPTVDQQITITAQVSAAASATTVVGFAGKVSFSNNGTPISGCTSQTVNTTTGNATCTIPAGLAAGTYSSIVAVFGGAGNVDPNYSGNTSANFSLSVAKLATSTAILANPTSSTVDNAVTLTAAMTVAPSAPVATPLTSFGAAGTVTFTDGANVLCGGPITVIPAAGTATASCSTTALAAGSHSINASFSGDNNYQTSSTTAAATVSMAKATPSFTSLVANPTSTSASKLALNTPVTYTATLTAPGNGVTMAGTVAFQDNGLAAACGTGGVVNLTSTVGSAIGTAVCTITNLTATSHAISAVYNGDTSNYIGVGTGLVNSYVAPSTSGTIALITTPTTNSTLNQQVTIQATVPFNAGTPLDPGSTIVFNDGANPVPGCTISFVKATGVATCTTQSLTQGAHTLTAIYSGDPNNQPGSGTAAITVATQGTNLAVASSVPAGSTVDQSVTFTATLTFANSGPFTPAGSVQFQDGAATIANCAAVAVSGSGTTYTATCTTNSLALASHAIKATYTDPSTSTNFASSNGSVVQAVTQNTTTTTIVSSLPTGSIVNQTVTFTATAKATIAGAAAAGSVPLTGTFEFKDMTIGADISGCSAVVAGSQATSGSTPWAFTATAICPTSALTATTHSIEAIYSGDTNFGGSTSAAASQTVTAQPVVVNLSASPTSSNYNQSVTFAATLAYAPGGLLPASTVTFIDSVTGSVIPGCNLPLGNPVTSAGVITVTANCTTSSLSVATHTITAQFSADPNFATTNPTVSFTVNPNTATLGLNVGATTAVTNGPVTFTATITGQPTTITLSGIVTFYDGATVLVCNTVGNTATTAVPVTAAGVASCTVNNVGSTSLAFGTHSNVTAKYSGDHLLQIPAASNAVGVTIQQGSVAVSAVAPTATYFGQLPVLTATVTQSNLISGLTPNSPIAPTGTVTFYYGTTVLCSSSSWTGNSVSCPQIGTVPQGSYGYSAKYAGDTNFSTATSTVGTYSVQDFSLTATPLTSSTTNFATPWIQVQATPTGFPVALGTPITISFPATGYTGTVGLTCTVIDYYGTNKPTIPAVASKAAVPPTCSLSASSVQLTAGTIASTVTLNLSANSSTTVGLYGVEVVATDPNNPTLATNPHFWAISNVMVVSEPAVSNGTVVVSGSTSSPTGVVFNVPSGVTITLPAGLSCPAYENVSTGLTPSVTGYTLLPDVTNGIYLSCTGTSQVTGTTSLGQQPITFQVTVSTTSTVSSNSMPPSFFNRGSGVVLAGLLGFGLIAGIRRRRGLITGLCSGLLVLMLGLGLLQTTGCGGSFTSNGGATSTGKQTQPGQYFVLVQAKGSDNNFYYSVLKVNVGL
jgi:sugar lactone lactonase YvrE